MLDQLNPSTKEDASLYRFLKFYLLLVIYEGIFRKWVQFSSVDIFYFFRDLITFLFIFKLVLLGRHKSIGNPNMRINLNILFSIFLLYGFIAVLFQNIPLIVVIFGIRNYISIFLLIYLCSFIRDKSQIFMRVYRIFLGSLLVQLPVVLLQVASKPDSFINKTSWGLGASVFTSGEVVRPPGTFTNALGLGYFILIVYGLILSSYLKGFDTRKAANINLIALFLLMIIIAISGSRTVLLGVSLTTILFLIIRIKKLILGTENSSPSKRSSLLIFISLSSLVFFVLYQLADVISAFLFRLQYQTEGGVGTRLRIIDSIFGYQISGVSLFGSGIGTRHQSALALGWIQPWVENESVRWSAEIGILGLLLVILRQIWISYLAFDVVFHKVCYSHLAPMIFVPLGPFLVSGISTQPTIQGMSAIMIIFIVFRKYI